MMAGWVERNYRRVQARTIGQLVRGASLRVWPLSRMVHAHYRRRMAPDNWDRVNAQARRNLEIHTRPLDAKQQEALSALRSQGVHTAMVRSFLGDDGLLLRLQADAERLLALPRIWRQIHGRRSREGIKWYVVRAFGYRPRKPVPDTFAELLLDDRVLSVVNSYLGMTSRLKYLDVWHNFAVSPSEPPVDSELWHRDNEDRNLVKLFVHLSDVGPAEGPLTYLRGSQPGGPIGDLFPNDPPAGSFPPAHILESRVSKDRIQPCTGAAGTMVFFDACGLHFGGRATGKARTMLVATYASDAALDLLKYRLAEPERLVAMSPQARYALHVPADAD